METWSSLSRCHLDGPKAPKGPPIPQNKPGRSRPGHAGQRSRDEANSRLQPRRRTRLYCVPHGELTAKAGMVQTGADKAIGQVHR